MPTHTPTIKLTLTKVDTEKYDIEGETLVCFEDENVAKNEAFHFKTQVVFTGEVAE